MYVTAHAVTLGTSDLDLVNNFHLVHDLDLLFNDLYMSTFSP